MIYVDEFWFQHIFCKSRKIVDEHSCCSSLCSSYVPCLIQNCVKCEWFWCLLMRERERRVVDEREGKKKMRSTCSNSSFDSVSISFHMALKPPLNLYT